MPVEGYLGAVGAAPLTDSTRHIGTMGEAVEALLSSYFPSLYAGFKKEEFLTEEGVRRQEPLSEVEGCSSAAVELLLYDNAGLYQPGWQYTSVMQEFVNLTANGRREIAGPLMLPQGDGDPAIPESLTMRVVDETCELFPRAQLNYTVYRGATHSGLMYAAQQEWLSWIEDRFAEKDVSQGCNRAVVGSTRAGSSVQKEFNYFRQQATGPYQVA